MLYLIPAVSLAFVLHAAGKKDVRFYLNGVYVERDLCTATDGHFMLRRRDAEQVAPAPLLIPRAAVEWAVKQTKGAGMVRVTRGEGRELAVEAGAQTLKCEEIDGQFPDCNAIIPVQNAPLETVAFNGRILIALAKAALAAGDRYSAVRIEPVGRLAARVDFPHLLGCGGVVMPLRNTEGVRPSVPV